MFHTLKTILFLSVMNTTPIYDFTSGSDVSTWNIVNDVVMGGVSRSAFTLDEKGNGVFAGTVSLENNGGFCMVRHGFAKISVDDYKKISIRLKGDGKRYQFRLKSDRNDYYSYVLYFNTSGDWETIVINLNDMYPVFRGQKLDMPPFSNHSIEEIGFLIGNKKEESFTLAIDKIVLTSF